MILLLDSWEPDFLVISWCGREAANPPENKWRNECEERKNQRARESRRIVTQGGNGMGVGGDVADRSRRKRRRWNTNVSQPWKESSPRSPRGSAPSLENGPGVLACGTKPGGDPPLVNLPAKGRDTNGVNKSFSHFCVYKLQPILTNTGKLPRNPHN